jgi:hypothetical protein
MRDRKKSFFSVPGRGGILFAFLSEEIRFLAKDREVARA